jgi:hypothetical protein
LDDAIQLLTFLDSGDIAAFRKLTVNMLLKGREFAFADLMLHQQSFRTYRFDQPANWD